MKMLTDEKIEEIKEFHYKRGSKMMRMRILEILNNESIQQEIIDAIFNLEINDIETS